jgi:catechol 2,3-dioxygenase-like lactoylglutathione lyase family enzyme
MKRFHVHLGVENLEQSIGFYSRLFGAEPTVRKPDYAKWMVDDPRLNFAISARGGRAGVNHLGLQAEDAEELAAIRANFSAADHATLQDEPGANCCYAHGDKHCVTDPQGIAWEGYYTLGEIRYFGETGDPDTATACGASPGATEASGCCTPSVATVSGTVGGKRGGCCATD